MFGIQDGGGKIVYGLYNPFMKIFQFYIEDPEYATPIDINYVFSAVPGAKNNSDDQFLSGTTTADILSQAHSDGTTGITFSELAGKVKSSV